MRSSDFIPILLFVLTVAFGTAGYFFRQFAQSVSELKDSVHSLDKTMAVLSNRVDHLEKK